MIQKWKVSALLAFSLAALGSFSYWFEFSHRPKKEEQEAEQKKVYGLKDQSLEVLRILNGAKVVRLQCKDPAAEPCKLSALSKWEIVEPQKNLADSSNVNSFLSSLNGLSVPDVISLKEETPEKRQALLKEYQLDEASRKTHVAKEIEVTWGGGKKRSAYFGATHPIGDKIFVAIEQDGKFDDSKVYLAPSYFNSNFDREVTYWRDKKILNFVSHEVKSFTYQTASGEKLSAEKKDGQWKLQSKGEALSGDIENIDNLLSGLAYLNAKSFVAENKNSPQAKKELAQAKEIFSYAIVDEKSATPTVVKFFEKKVKTVSSTYVTSSASDPLYEIEGTKDRFQKTLKDLRLSKLITSVERFTAKRLEFSGTPIGQPPVVLTQENSKWFADAAKKQEAVTEKVQSFLDKLSSTRITEFLDASKPQPKGEESAVKVALGDDQSQRKRFVAIWQEGTQFYARDLLSKRGEVFKLDAVMKEHLPTSRTFFSLTTPGQSGGKKE